MDALAKDEALLDPSELFTSGAAGALDAEDVAYWNVDLGSTDTEPETTDVEPAALPAPEPSQPPTKRRRRRKLDRMAVPDDGPQEAGADSVPFVPPTVPKGTPQQLTLF